MSFDLKQIPGAVVQKIEMDFYGESTLPYNQTCVDVGFNNGIEKQSSVRLRMNREKAKSAMIQATRKLLYPDGVTTYTLYLSNMEWDAITDAIIANELEIIEVDENKEGE